MLAWTILGGSDPFDRFEVIGVDGPSVTGKHAVTFRHHHANSSNDVIATWLQRERPSLGSRVPPSRGALLVLVATSPSVVASRHWHSDKLIVAIAEGTTLQKGTNCYFDENPMLACYEPSVVEVAQQR
jgi:hypothetical protein